MDILDIVNSHLKERELLVRNKLQEIVIKLNAGEKLEQLSSFYKVEPSLIKDYLKKENYSFDVNLNIWIKKDLLEEVVGDYISIEQISTVPYKLFYGSNLDFISKQNNISITMLKEALNNYNYKKRWTSINYVNKSTIHPEVLRIEHLLNTEKYSLQDVAEYFNTEVDELKETLKAANFQKVWTLESKIESSKIKTYIDGLTIVRDLDTGIIEYITTSETNYFTSNQANSILGINSNYFYNLASNKFILNKHFLQLSKEAERKIVHAIPTLNSTKLELLFSEIGLNLLAELSNREGAFSQCKIINKTEEAPIDTNSNPRFNESEGQDDGRKIIETNALLEKSNNGSSSKYSPILEGYLKEEDINIENIVNRLNKGETLYDISIDFVINRKLRVPFVIKLQSRIEEGYIYNKLIKQWDQKSSDSDINNVENNKVEKSNFSKKDLDIKEIVSYLNKVNSFHKVEEKFGITTTELRILIKNKGYKYDAFFKLWTKNSRNALLKETSYALEKGIQSYSELESRGVNIKALEQEIKHRDEMTQVIKSIRNKKDSMTHSSQIDRNDSIETESLSFKKEEIQTLRKMISEWQGNKSNEQLINNQTLEVTFRINKEMLEQIEDYSDDNRISKSMVLEKALNQFFENNKQTQQYYFHEDKKIKEDIIRPEDHIVNEKELDLRVRQKENPNNWDSAKENLLISAIIEGTRAGRTIKVITEDVSKEIGIPAKACHSFWNSKSVANHYKEEYKQIKLDQEMNWSDEDIQLLEHLIFVKYAHLTPFDVLPIASECLKKHIDVVRKKLFELQRAKRVQSD